MSTATPWFRVHFLQQDIFDDDGTPTSAEYSSMTQAKVCATAHGPGSYIMSGDKVLYFVNQEGKIIKV